MRIVKEPKARKNEILNNGMAQKPQNSQNPPKIHAQNPIEEFLPVLHEPANARFHQKVLSGCITCLTPVFLGAVERILGGKSGSFSGFAIAFT